MKDNTSGNDDEYSGQDANDDDDKHLGQIGAIGGGDASWVVELDLGHREADQLSQESWHEVGNLRGSPVENHGLPGGVEGALERWQAAPEVKFGALGDDDVYPGSAELDKSQGGEQSCDRRKHGTHDADEDAHEESGHELLGEQAEETTEQGLETTVGAEQAGHGADGGGDGRGLAGDGLRRVLSGLLSLTELVIEGDWLVGGRLLVLNHGEDGVDLAGCVVDLMTRHQYTDRWKLGGAPYGYAGQLYTLADGGTTYIEDHGDEKNHVNQENEPCPGRDIVLRPLGTFRAIASLDRPLEDGSTDVTEHDEKRPRICGGYAAGGKGNQKSWRRRRQEKESKGKDRSR